jgi:hypothetical protein
MRLIDLKISDKGRIWSVDWVAWIMNEIEGKQFTRKDVAKTYAILIQCGHKDWTVINEAIIKRWSGSGWQWIKTQAWKRLEHEHFSTV